ncbi:MAG: cellulose biosynthesis protein BcsS [Burkholderiales bacterium]
MIRRRVVAALLSMAAATPSLADGRLFLAGSEIRQRGEHYAYVGALLPLPGDNRLGQGWVQRYWLDANRYGYDVSDPARYPVDPQRIRARSSGAEAAIGYHVTRGPLTVAGYAGLRYADVKFTPDDPGSRVRGANLWPKLQLDIATPVGSHWRAQHIAAWTFGLQSYWVRTRWLRATASGVDVGGELVVVGDRDYSALKAGLVVGALNPVPGATLGFRVGYHVQRAANSPYAGVELVVDF